MYMETYTETWPDMLKVVEANSDFHGYALEEEENSVMDATTGNETDRVLARYMKTDIVTDTDI